MKARYLFPLFLILAACAGNADGGYPGSYQANLPAADSAGRTITLQLGSDGGATFTQNYQNGEAPIVETGSWVGSEEAIDVTGSGSVLTFTHGDDGSLSLVNPDSAEWGANGLTLYRTTDLIDSWVWQQTVANGQTTDPSTPGAFILIFSADGKITVATDCNSGFGAFQVGPQQALSMPVIATTKKFCEGSNEGDFYAQLGIVDSYSLTADGVLELHLGGEGGTMDFVPPA
jgi:heat shock protein HslJ